MRLVVLSLVFVSFLGFAAPGAQAACSPASIDYVVGNEYPFTCSGGFWRGALAVDISRQESAIDVCLGNSCWEGCGNVLFYGSGEGRVLMDLYNVFVAPELRVCTATVGTVYLY